MKILIICFFIATSVFARSDMEQQLFELQQRVKQLEAQNSGNNSNVDSQSGLKVKDMQNSQVQNGIGGARDISSTGNSPELTKEQQDEIMKTIEQYKKNQEAQQKILDELMNEP